MVIESDPIGEVVHNVSFADDIQLIAKTPPEMQQMYEDLKGVMKPIGLQLNPTKTQYITNISPSACVRLPGDNQTGKGMIVLGKLVDTTDTTDRDMNRKIANSWAKFRRILPVLTQKSSLRHRLRNLTILRDTSHNLGG